MAIDAHCHLNDEAYNDDLFDIVGRLSADNVNIAVIAGYNLDSSLKALEISKRSDNLYCALGFHPENIDEIKNGDFERIKELYVDKKVVAVGEIGLDYHFPPFDKEKQKEIFAYQLELADEVDLPVIIHQRDCGMDILNILKKKMPKRGVMLHCFSESVEMLKEFLKLRCYISIGGTVTFKNARSLLDVAKLVPNELILTETDCPYLSPTPFRGQRNEPKNVNLVQNKLAELRQTVEKEFEKQVEENFKRLFYKVK